VDARPGSGETFLWLLCGEQKSQNPPHVKYWEIIADNLSKAGWSWAASQRWILAGERSSFADAHRGDGKRFVVRADEKLTVFVELESAIRAASVPKIKTNHRSGPAGWLERLVRPLRRSRSILIEF